MIPTLKLRYVSFRDGDTGFPRVAYALKKEQKGRSNNRLLEIKYCSALSPSADLVVAGKKSPMKSDVMARVWPKLLKFDSPVLF